MDAGEYRAAIEALGYSQEGFAAAIGLSPRTGQNYALGESRVAPPVALLLRLLLARPELKGLVESLGPPPVRTRSDRPSKKVQRR